MAGVDPVTFWTVASAGGTAMFLLATAIYFNRRMVNSLYQRLFGMDADDTHDGHVHEMQQKLDNLRQQSDRLRQQMDEQHRQVYEKLEELEDGD